MSRPGTAPGARDGRLAPCPDKPHCVCSFDQDAGHAIEPLRYDAPPEAAWDLLQSVVRAMPRVTWIATEKNYLHCAFRSLWLGFIDDVEFLHDPQAAVIHVRSASRIGYSDLGVNRRRVEAIRNQFQERLVAR